MTTKSIRVIFDTNVWISFLIGKRLASIENHISKDKLLLLTDLLLSEIERVSSREKIKK